MSTTRLEFNEYKIKNYILIDTDVPETVNFTLTTINIQGKIPVDKNIVFLLDIGQSMYKYRHLSNIYIKTFVKHLIKLADEDYNVSIKLTIIAFNNTASIIYKSDAIFDEKCIDQLQYSNDSILSTGLDLARLITNRDTKTINNINIVTPFQIIDSNLCKIPKNCYYTYTIIGEDFNHRFLKTVSENESIDYIFDFTVIPYTVTNTLHKFFNTTTLNCKLNCNTHELKHGVKFLTTEFIFNCKDNKYNNSLYIRSVQSNTEITIIHKKNTHSYVYFEEGNEKIYPNLNTVIEVSTFYYEIYLNYVKTAMDHIFDSLLSNCEDKVDIVTTNLINITSISTMVNNIQHSDCSNKHNIVRKIMLLHDNSIIILEKIIRDIRFGSLSIKNILSYRMQVNISSVRNIEILPEKDSFLKKVQATVTSYLSEN
jgi:hypothetical protein